MKEKMIQKTQEQVTKAQKPGDLLLFQDFFNSPIPFVQSFLLVPQSTHNRPLLRMPQLLQYQYFGFRSNAGPCSILKL